MSAPPKPVLLSVDDRADIQGFVTSGFGHLPNTAYLFLNFDDTDGARLWLRSVLPSITDARSWRTQSDAPKAKPNRAFNLAFTPAGLEALGLPHTSLDTFPEEFVQGMAFPERSRILGDTDHSAPIHWHLGGPKNPPIHALAILHATSSTELARDRDAFLSKAAIHRIALPAEECGHRPADDREPFGFRDGIAQPRLEGIHGEGLRTGEFILGYVNEYGYLPVGPLVKACDDSRNHLPPSDNPNQLGWHDFGRNGTYLVYRKLEQHVSRFWRFIAQESLRLPGPSAPGPSTMAWLASKMMGRWPDGTPTTLSPDTENSTLSHQDKFLYASHDRSGHHCPMGAHIRRMNPRDHLPPAGATESLHMTARHRLLRRGRPYGFPLNPTSIAERWETFAATLQQPEPAEETSPCGLHFLALNANIKRQFEFLQQAWANNPQFGGLTGNPDPIIGHRGTSDSLPCMRIPGVRFESRTNPLPEFVTVRGGAYLFMPGIRSLRYLAGA